MLSAQILCIKWKIGAYPLNLQENGLYQYFRTTFSTTSKLVGYWLIYNDWLLDFHRTMIFLFNIPQSRYKGQRGEPNLLVSQSKEPFSPPAYMDLLPVGDRLARPKIFWARYTQFLLTQLKKGYLSRDSLCWMREKCSHSMRYILLIFVKNIDHELGQLLKCDRINRHISN
jgi:hypothetical protein